MDEKGKWKSIGSWSIITGLAETNRDARAILLAWKTGVPLGEAVDFSKWQYRKEMVDINAWPDYDFESVYDHERSPPG
ncbi:hypothetical protein ES703_43261 [subsurface metagenome]